MIFAASLSIINLILYCVQQLGVTLGVGAETVLLVAYLQSMRDGVVDDKEKGFARAVRHVMDFGLFFIIISGIGVVASSYLSGQQELFSTIFLFKWSLIGIVLFMSLANRGSSLTAGLLQGLSAGTWYALFVVHILAPQASWLELGAFYAVWLGGFSLCWTLIVFALRGKPGIRGSLTPPPVSKAVLQPAVVITANKVMPPPHVVPPPPPPAQKMPPPIPPAPIVVKPIPAVVAAPVPFPVPPPPPAKPIIQPPPPPLPKVILPMPPVPVIKIQSPDVPIPPVPPSAPPPAEVKTGPLIGLHVMPRTLEEVQQRRATLG